jgi:hypothetical protein
MLQLPELTRLILDGTSYDYFLDHQAYVRVTHGWRMVPRPMFTDIPSTLANVLAWPAESAFPPGLQVVAALVNRFQ